MTATITTLHPRGGVIPKLFGSRDREALRHVLAGGQLVRLEYGFDEEFAEDLRVAREHGKSTRPIVTVYGDYRGGRQDGPRLNVFSMLDVDQMAAMLLELIPADQAGEPGLLEDARRVLRHAAGELKRPTTLLQLSEDLFAENARPKTVKARVSIMLAARAHVFAHGRAGQSVAASEPTHDLTTLLSRGESLYVCIPRMGRDQDGVIMQRMMLRALTNALRSLQAPRGTNLMVLLDDVSAVGSPLLQELSEGVRLAGGRLAQ